MIDGEPYMPAAVITDGTGGSADGTIDAEDFLAAIYWLS